MYFKTTAGKKAVKLMLRGTLLKLGYHTTVRVIFSSEDCPKAIDKGDLL